MILLDYFRDRKLTKTETFIRARFGEAIRFAAVDWKGWNRLLEEKRLGYMSLSERMVSFLAGPISNELLRRFPEINEVGQDADRKIGVIGHRDVLLRNIIGESVVRSRSHGRSKVRQALETLDRIHSSATQE